MEWEYEVHKDYSCWNILVVGSVIWAVCSIIAFGEAAVLHAAYVQWGGMYTSTNCTVRQILQIEAPIFEERKEMLPNTTSSPTFPSICISPRGKLILNRVSLSSCYYPHGVLQNIEMGGAPTTGEVWVSMGYVFLFLFLLFLFCVYRHRKVKIQEGIIIQ